jgi:hypothetical protein
MADLIPPQHIGDGLYMKDEGWRVSIAANHHENNVASIDMNDIDTAIEYLKRVKQRIERK